MDGRGRGKRSTVEDVKVASVAAVALLALAPHLAQQKPPLKSNVEVTVVTVTVRDANGRLVTELGRDAFQVYEDGAPMTVTQFTNERVPLGAGVLLDISDSMFGHRINDARTAVERFLDLLAPADAFFVMAFNHEPHLLFGWKTDRAGVHEALDKLRPSGGTAIYDAILAAEPYITARPRERAALVLITDGADTASDTTFHDLRPTLVRTDTFVYAIAIDTPEPQPIASRVDVQALTDITSQSGGYTEVVRDTADLQTATANIADELNKQYVLGYSSPHPGDGQYHSIRVRTVDPTYRVHARSGYIAMKR